MASSPSTSLPQSPPGSPSSSPHESALTDSPAASPTPPALLSEAEPTTATSTPVAPSPDSPQSPPTSSTFDFAEKSQAMLEGLEQLWDEMGLSSTLRLESRSQISRRIQEIFDSELQKVEATRDECIDEIDQLEIKQFTLCASLDVPRPVNTEDVESTTLYEIITAYQNGIEELLDLVELRTKELNRLQQSLNILAVDLGDGLTSPFCDSISDEDLSQSKVDRFKEEESRLTELKRTRRTEISSLTESIKATWTTLRQELTEEPSSSLGSQISQYQVGDATTHALLPCSAKCLADLTSLNKYLEAEKKKREDVITRYGYQIIALWDRLEVDQATRDAFFVTSSKGLSLFVIDACKEEFRRLEELKAEKLVGYIQQEREKIGALWDQLKASESQRAAFKEFTSEEYTDAVLAAHEALAKSLQSRYDASIPIIGLLTKLSEKTKEKEQLDERASDPRRLLDRRSGVNIMKEDNRRKRVTKEIPAIEEALMKSLADWPLQFPEEGPFMYDGEDCLAEMIKKKEARIALRKAEQEKKKRERQERLGITPSKPKLSSRIRPTGTPLKSTGTSSRKTPMKSVRRTPMKTTKPLRTPSKVPATPSRVRSNTIPAQTPSRSRVAKTPLRSRMTNVGSGPLAARLHSVKKKRPTTASSKASSSSSTTTTATMTSSDHKE